MAKVTAPLLSLKAKGRIGQLVIYYGEGNARGWSEQMDPQTAQQLQSRAIVKEVMQLIGTCSGIDRAWLRENYGRAWHTKLVAWLTRSSLANAQAVYQSWGELSEAQRQAWEDQAV